MPRGERKRCLDRKSLLAYFSQHPDAYLLEVGNHFRVSGTAIFKACKRWKITRKKNLYCSARDEARRRRFRREIARLDESTLVYIDECGIELESYRPHARSTRGKKVECPTDSIHPQRISLISAYHQGRLQAPMRIEGTTDTDVFNAWVEHLLAPSLQPGQTVILDNARFHQSNRTRELIEKVGCNIKFLPPYSPDLNPIEHQWHSIKSQLRLIQPPPSQTLRTIDSIVVNMSKRYVV